MRPPKFGTKKNLFYLYFESVFMTRFVTGIWEDDIVLSIKVLFKRVRTRIVSFKLYLHLAALCAVIVVDGACLIFCMLVSVMCYIKNT